MTSDHARAQPIAPPFDPEDPGNWDGGYYEIAIKLGPRDDARLGAALTALWTAANVHGCFVGTTGSSHTTADPDLVSLEKHGHLRGVVEPPAIGPVVAGVLALRSLHDDQDWITLYIPMGALAKTDPRIGGFPFGPAGTNASLLWRRGLDAWLADIGRSVYGAVPFQQAQFGYETDNATGNEPPQNRMIGLLVPDGADLTYLGATASPTSSFTIGRVDRARWAIRSLANRFRRPR